MKFTTVYVAAGVMALAPFISAAPAPVSPNEPEFVRRANSGDLTYYEVGLGACGWVNHDSEMVAAMSHEQMGYQSNGNPYCGKRIEVHHGRKSITVTVVDKCMGCAYNDLDLSPAAFRELAPEYEGRILGLWNFV
ncbi:hypothetical protein NHQ30_010209 [Ciborinia camelliae]|nr:hypothetical protein NHQ30_010209 [Ciborinia camelliae]